MNMGNKFVLILTATATVLGLGANLSSVPNVSAHHVRTYKVRRQNVRKNHKKLRRSVNKIRAKSHYTKKHARRNAKQRMNKRAENTKATKKTRKSRNRKTRVSRKGISHRLKKHGKRTYRHRNHKYIKDPYARFSHAQLAAWAKIGAGDPDTSVKDFINWNKKIYPAYGQPVKPYNLDGEIDLLSNYQLKKQAKKNGMSVPQYLKKYTRSASKYWYADGESTPLAYKVMDQDAIKDLNQTREQMGEQPVVQDPTLQFIAQKRIDQDIAQTMNGTWHQTHLDGYNEHQDQNGNLINITIAQKYHLPELPAGENFVSGAPFGGSFDDPAQDAQSENNAWDKGHQELRTHNLFSRAGIAIGPGAVAEEFAD